MSYSSHALFNSYLDAAQELSELPKHLIIRDLTDGIGKEVGSIESGSVAIGREPETGIQFDRPAISRTHGLFIATGTSWVYGDLGSTNGSWINNDKVESASFKIIRNGDVLQLADSILSMEDSSGVTDSASSLIVLHGANFYSEFPINVQGRIISVGGIDGDIPLQNDNNEHPALVFDFSVGTLYVESRREELAVSLNGQKMGVRSRLKDRDELQVGGFHILINMPGLEAAKIEPQEPLQKATPSPAFGTFGKPGIQVERMEDPTHRRGNFGGEAAPSSRRFARGFGDDRELPVEYKILIALCIFFAAALSAAIVVWLIA